MVLRSPITSSHGSPAYFLSCGIAPSELNWKMRLSRPMVVRPSITQCGPTLVPAPILTCGPISVYAPIDADESISARGSTMAVGWIAAGIGAATKSALPSAERAHRAHELGLA